MCYLIEKIFTEKGILPENCKKSLDELIQFKEEPVAKILKYLFFTLPSYFGCHLIMIQKRYTKKD
ncbi:MAG: hypothetical protein DRP00_00310 [Candidatus Aenigmatarchaeota archaeon]|nr:MAG: hypothetical protein DRP00_00310 [Candidatus Aenigmarchaeota archaeon]